MKPRILISGDIGGSDPDDLQSLVHQLLCLDSYDLEGIIASPPKGNIAAIKTVIQKYKKDYPKLKDKGFPTAETILSVVRQGAKNPAPKIGWSKPTPGSKHIIKQAMKDDPRPLLICVGGGLTDIAQAIHDKPEIKKKIRVFYIGSWNTEKDPHSFNYVVTKHSNLHLIVCDSSFRGIYLDGVKAQNIAFVKNHVKPAGHLGAYFYKISENINVNKYGIKMGDTPAFLFCLKGNFDYPGLTSWGGSYDRELNNIYVDSNYPRDKIGIYKGAKTVARFRQDFLDDFKRRLEWLK